MDFFSVGLVEIRLFGSFVFFFGLFRSIFWVGSVQILFFGDELNDIRKCL